VVIEWEVAVNNEHKADHQWVVGWNLAAMTGKGKEASKKLRMELSKGTAHLDSACTDDEVEQEAKWCEETLSKVPDFTA